MADWYVSSVAWAALPQFAASHVYSVGNIIRPLTTPTYGHEYAFRCTTAGTSSTEPSWPNDDGSTVTTGGATFTNVSGKPTYNWNAPAGTIQSLTANIRITGYVAAGDRVFVSSDHSETNTTINLNQMNGATGVALFISVNRAGSVPPVVADYLAGATITATAGSLSIDPGNLYWQGFSFVQSSTSAQGISFGSSTTRNLYFKNCSFNLNTGQSNSHYVLQGVKVIFDNATFQFSHASQYIYHQYPTDVLWINTPSAITGSTFPTTLFYVSGMTMSPFTLRGVDLSAITGNLVNDDSNGSPVKVLLDSCRINPSVTRLVRSAASVPFNDVELVNCFDGTNVINERWQQSGTVITDRSTYLASGAQDDIGNYGLKLATTAWSDFQAAPMDCFAFDTENAAVGVSKTAKIELLSSTTLNNNDIRLLIEFMGGVYATWNSADQLNMVLSNGNLTALNNGSNAWVRGNTALPTTGKWYFEITSPNIVSTGTSYGVASSTAANPASSSSQATSFGENGYVFIDNNLISSYGALPLVGATIGVAVDMVNHLLWYWRSDTSVWINSGNPAAGTNGFNISTLVAPIYPVFTSGATGTTDKGTINVGATPFVNTIPSGFSPLPVSTTSSIASMTDSLPSVLTAASALPSSSNTWTGVPSYLTWSPYDIAVNVVLSGGNLIATTNTSSQGGVRHSIGYNTGKYYFEMSFTIMGSTSDVLGLCLSSTLITNNLQPGSIEVNGGGTIFYNTVNTGVSIGTPTTSSKIGIAVDFGAKLAWFRIAPSGNWNGSGTANPATGVGGQDITAILTGPLYPFWVAVQSGDQVTGNFGASGFTGAVPSGFTSGWPFTQTKQLLQTTFTPQRAGRVRGLVRLGKPSTTVWVNPQIAIT